METLSTKRLADYHWLVSDAAAGWLKLAGASDEPTLKIAATLRKDLSTERTHLVLEQTALRRRATAKFLLAGRMFFTPIGLEQATDQWTAAHKSVRFPKNRLLADFCCGVGGDLIALAGRGETIGVDRDPVIAILAEANLAACRTPEQPLQQAQAQVAEVSEFDARSLAAWHLDPDRRPAGRRTTRAVAHDPPPETIERLLAACPNGAIKLAPAAELLDGWPSRAELEWISRQRECRQLVAWFGELAQQMGQSRATVLSADGSVRRTISGSPGAPLPIAPKIGRYVFEPDAAVLAAKLTGAMTAEHNLAAITSGIAYLTADRSIDDGALACFEVLDLLPLKIKQIKSWLQERCIGRLEIKKRGVDVDPEQLRRQLQGAGDESATLLLLPLDGRSIVIAARRVVRQIDANSPLVAD